MSYYYKSDYGIDIIVNCNKNISAATAMAITYRKPDGTTGSWTGTVYNTNYVKYTTQTGDIDQSGTWRFQAYVTGAGPIHGDTVELTFKDLFEPYTDFSISSSTNIGKVRYLIGDTDRASFSLSDTAINAILTVNSNDILMSASQCMLAIASSKALLARKRTAGNYSEDLSMVAKECREAAKMFQEMAISTPAEAQAEQFFTDFNYREILYNKDLREENE